MQDTRRAGAAQPAGAVRKDGWLKAAERRLSRVEWLSFVGIVALLAIWEIAAHLERLSNPTRADTILPTIEYVARNSLPELATFYGVGMGGSYAGAASSYPTALAVIAYHSAITMGRVLGGVFLGMALGIGVGLLMGWSGKFRSVIEAPLMLLRTIPILALIPIFLVWFGGREVGNILYIAWAVFAMIVINTIEAVRNVPPIYRQFALTQGATRGQVFRTVILPAIIPELTGGIRVALGLAWAITLAAEYLAAQSGLGRIMILSEHFLFTGRMIVVVFLFMIYSVILNALFLRLARYITRWMPEEA